VPLRIVTPHVEELRMTVKAGYSTPMLHVADVERSLRFYSLLGFETIDVERGGGVIGWARAHCEGGALMFLRAEEPHVEPGAAHDRILFYLYTPDLPALHAQLAAAGVEVGSIDHPEHMPSGEICLRDPDGYVVLVGHWSDGEHEAWLRRVEEKRAAGLIP
jgi:catechol 2,3-dioxygenase-like lactoylglutathione lyase family enzyme